VSGDLIVNDGKIIVEPDIQQKQSKLVLRNDALQNAFKLLDTDSGLGFLQRLSADGLRFEWLDANSTGASDGVDMVIEVKTGNIGIATLTPTEKLDVNGTIHLSGVNSKITSDGDLCIGSGCP